MTEEPAITYAPEGTGQPVFERIDNSGDRRTVSPPMRQDRPRLGAGAGAIYRREGGTRVGWFGAGVIGRGLSSSATIRIR